MIIAYQVIILDSFLCRENSKNMARISLGLKENWAFVASLLCCIGVYYIRYRVDMTPYVIIAAIMLNGAGLVLCFIAIFQSTSFYKLLSIIYFIFLAYGVIFIAEKMIKGIL